MANKLKVADKFSAIKAMLNGEKVENFSIDQAVEFIDERIAMVNAKNAKGGERKPTKTQLENEGIKERIAEILLTADKPMTATEVGKAMDLTCSKVSALLTQLVKSNTVVRTEVKGRAYFAPAEQE